LVLIEERQGAMMDVIILGMTRIRLAEFLRCGRSEGEVE